jgi:cytoskeleton protein RodZ
LLRKAREARGLSVSDVVQVLKFRARQIEALEADEIALVPGTVFVRGFVRSYARLLRIDPEPLLALLDAETPAAQPEVRAPENMGTAMPRGGLRHIPPLVLASILLLVVAAGLAAWHYLASGAIGLPTLVGTSSKRIASVVEVPVPVVVAAPTAEPSVIAPNAVPTAVPVPVTTTENVMPPENQKALVFDFRGKSWVEVKDASQRIVFTGQYVSGSHEVINGQPPFQIVVGNANEVALQFDGHAVDLRPFTRAEVARLTLE